MQDVKGTAMPVPAADATTDALQRNDVPVGAPEAGGALSPVRPGVTYAAILAASFILHSPATMSALQNQNG